MVKSKTIDHQWDFAYDAAGQMVQAEPEAGIVTYTYNADGQRVAKEGEVIAGVGYLYDQKKLLHETDDIGAINKTFASDMSDEYGDLIGEGGHLHQYDAQANTEALLEADGTVEARYKYTAFGQVHAVQLGVRWRQAEALRMAE